MRPEIQSRHILKEDKPIGIPTKITVEAINPISFEVTVQCAKTTKHTVTLSEDYYKKMTNEKITAERLIERSFKFLLERENNTSILSSFDLPLIKHYFPEYEKTILRIL